MNKELIKCYEHLELPYNATIEDVQDRKKALIKIYNSKVAEEGLHLDKVIRKIETSAMKIIENIKKNGIPEEEFHKFDSSWTNVFILASVLIFVFIICVYSFYIFT